MITIRERTAGSASAKTCENWLSPASSTSTNFGSFLRRATAFFAASWFFGETTHANRGAETESLNGAGRQSRSATLWIMLRCCEPVTRMLVTVFDEASAIEVAKASNPLSPP